MSTPTLNERPGLRISAERIRVYVERRREELARCQAGLRSGDYDWAELMGHRLRGNAATFGFPELGEIGERIERAARDRDRAGLEREVARFSDWVAART
jgi:HPt (histidine-containing phosphotransfer) domain-containing protein